MVKIAINGFGRIGRLVFRALVEKQHQDFEVVAINDLGSKEANAHLLKYDSVHGCLNTPFELTSEGIKILHHNIKMIAEPNPASLPWGAMGIDVVLECSGRFTSKEAAMKHIEAGARKVLVSAPADNADITVVYGVNHAQISSHHLIISNASCTTNCLAPVAKMLNDSIGIKHGYMTTVHAYTGDQSLVDTTHKDLRRARAAGLSMIPSSTGAAKAVGLVIPELKGKLDGTAIRVPTPNVSLIDFKFVAARPVTSVEINGVMREAASAALKGVLNYTEEPLVSMDFNHSAYSATFDATQTQVIENSLCRVVAWYDNEWGFSNRMVDTYTVIASFLKE